MQPNPYSNGKRSGERGMALILAIGFLAVLSILGAVVLTAANRGLSGTGISLPELQAFYAADRAVEYSMNRDIIINIGSGGTIDLVSGNLPGGGGKTHKDVIDGSGGLLKAGTVDDLGPNTLPPSIASFFGSDFGANFYHVEVSTTGPAKTQANVNASIVRLFKMDDDTIFRTSGGG
jgi:hypothetical protein